MICCPHCRKSFELVDAAAKDPRIAIVQRVVAKAFGQPVEIMNDRCRVQRFAEPRIIAMAICVELLGNEIPARVIARSFSRHHSMIAWAMHRCQALRDTDAAYRVEYRGIFIDCTNAVLCHERSTA